MSVKALRWLGDRLFPIGVVVWLHGVALRLTVRDSVDVLAPLYYATPWPVLAALTLVLSWRFRRQPAAVFAGLFLTHVGLGLWLLEAARTGERPRAPGDLRVVQWNVAHVRTGIAPVARALRAMEADVIALAEPHPTRGEQAAQWRAEFPGYAARFTGEELLCLVRGEVRAEQRHDLGPGSVAAQFEVVVKGREFTVVQADLLAVIGASRREPLARLAAVVASVRDRPIVVLGDFNTPRDSVHFAPLRREVVNAFERAGLGVAETWPLPLPVLSLDQVWCGRGLVPHFCEQHGTWRSDHRPVVADLRFAPVVSGR